ncbi:hypothetical protein [Chroococcidiopsis sp. CCMEE 29]|uniref:hypothetical protein n=1 Tax=Chroococcidiopsis sp. CCMEE 29 TaxID=155894 RepID=UPI0031F8D141
MSQLNAARGLPPTLTGQAVMGNRRALWYNKIQDVNVLLPNQALATTSCRHGQLA